MAVLTEGQRLGVYRIVRLLGEGGMGAVYEARQEPLERRVALKTLHADHAKSKEFIARFFNEAKVLSRLEHPSLVQVSDFGHAADGTAYLVMEYLRGQSLGGRIRDLSERGERLPVETALHVCVQVADVLAMAHEQGIVHRDLKPENLMLVGDPVAPGGERVKVLDFGIAKLTDDRGGVKTATDQVMGTPAYMSPEQCAGAGGVDAQTDVYALGCVLYELLAGRTPFVADGPGRLIGMHLFQEPPTLLSVAPQVPTEIAELVHRMLRKDKTQRPTMKESAKELARQLSRQTAGTLAARSPVEPITDGDETKAIARVVQVSTIGRSIGQRVKQPATTRSGLLFGGVGVLVMGLVVAVWIGTRPASKPQPVQATKPSIAETEEPNRERPDLGTEPKASSGESSKETSKPETVTAPAVAAKPKTPPNGKSPMGVQPARPVNKTPAKKRFGYEE
jgi:serine/threonine protein kinase